MRVLRGKKVVKEALRAFEISKRLLKNGRRKFKVVLHEIYPDDCIDTNNEVGTIYNKNGITWIREYCEKAAETIKDMSLRVEFLDDERTEILGHGNTGFEEGLPTFENAEVIGHFTKGYVDTIKDKEDVEHTVMIGEGYIDEMCYKAYVSKLEEEMSEGNAPAGSVEICHTDDNETIVYKYGYKDEGRIPMEFVYSGYALISVTAADDQAKMIELNEQTKECENTMTDAEIKAIIEQTVNELSSREAEMNECKQNCETQISEANAAKETAIAEMNEAIATSQQIQAALDACRKELDEAYQKIDALYDEMKVLNKEIGEARAKERIAAMEGAIAQFNDEQRGYAKEEIEAFKADPEKCEINTITDKILREIGAKAMEAAANEAKIAAEQNEAKNTEEIDIFSDMAKVNEAAEDVSIF